jgi:hypothetical protein
VDRRREQAGAEFVATSLVGGGLTLPARFRYPSAFPAIADITAEMRIEPKSVVGRQNNDIQARCA